MTTQLFTYGTLMLPEVMHSVTGKEYKSSKAVLRGYRRGQIKGADFPGIIESPDNYVEGLVYFDISTEALTLIDSYEENIYDRKLVEIELLENKKSLEAFAYILPSSKANMLLTVDWSESEYRGMRKI